MRSRRRSYLEDPHRRGNNNIPDWVKPAATPLEMTSERLNTKEGTSDSARGGGGNKIKDRYPNFITMLQPINIVGVDKVHLPSLRQVHEKKMKKPPWRGGSTSKRFQEAKKQEYSLPGFEEYDYRGPDMMKRSLMGAIEGSPIEYRVAFKSKAERMSTPTSILMGDTRLTQMETAVTANPDLGPGKYSQHSDWKFSGRESPEFMSIHRGIPAHNRSGSAPWPIDKPRRVFMASSDRFKQKLAKEQREKEEADVNDLWKFKTLVAETSITEHGIPLQRRESTSWDVDVQSIIQRFDSEDYKGNTVEIEQESGLLSGLTIDQDIDDMLSIPKVSRPKSRSSAKMSPQRRQLRSATEELWSWAESDED